METKRFDAKVKAAGPGDGLEEGQFTAYASVFGGEPDSYGDVVRKGAFANSLKEWADSGNVLPTLYGHNMSDPFANIGAVVDIKEDDHGLLVKTQLDLDNPTAAQVYRLIKGRRLSQMSFAFDTLDEGQVDVGGQKANELREMKLYEVSVVPIGANQDTEILAVKAAHALDTKSEADVLSAIDALTAATKQLQELLPAIPVDEAEVEQKASGTDPANAEEPLAANAEEPGPSPSAKTFAQIQLLALNGQTGDSQ